MSFAQSRQGDVVGTLSAGALKYHGELSDDMFGPIGQASLRYAALDRLWIETRLSIGEYRWKITDAKLAAYPDYFGQGAQIGDTYPGSLTTIESENESRATTVDLLLSYVLVDNIPSSPFISAGLGLINFAPSNSSEHSALPNSDAGIYPRSAVSFILGGGVDIPISSRIGIQFRGEHRFVLSQYLDDVAKSGINDALNTFAIGFTYRFNNTDPDDIVLDEECEEEEWCCDEVIEPDQEDVSNCYCNCNYNCNCTSMACISYSMQPGCCCPCCCCCCCGKGDGLSTGGGKPATAGPAVPQEPASSGTAEAKDPPPVPEPMDVPCPKGQHRECFGPPGMGICVDDDPPIGPEKIRWDLSRKLDDGSDLRETDGKWYRRQRQSDGTYRITKGLLPFEAKECKECKEKQLGGL